MGCGGSVNASNRYLAEGDTEVEAVVEETVVSKIEPEHALTVGHEAPDSPQPLAPLPETAEAPEPPIRASRASARAVAQMMPPLPRKNKGVRPVRPDGQPSAVAQMVATYWQKEAEEEERRRGHRVRGAPDMVTEELDRVVSTEDRVPVVLAW